MSCKELVRLSLVFALTRMMVRDLVRMMAVRMEPILGPNPTRTNLYKPILIQNLPRKRTRALKKCVCGLGWCGLSDLVSTPGPVLTRKGTKPWYDQV